MAAQLKGLFELRTLLYKRKYAFLKPAAYSFPFWCERAFKFAKNRTVFVVIKKQTSKPM